MFAEAKKFDSLLPLLKHQVSVIEIVLANENLNCHRTDRSLFTFSNFLMKAIQLILDRSFI